jgi:hypothetical protein
MLKAKINENGVFLINRGGAMQAMVCPFGSGNCGAHCPFFTFEPSKTLVIDNKPFVPPITTMNEVRLTCMEVSRKFMYEKSDFLDDRVSPLIDEATKAYVESTIQNVKNFEEKVKK